MRAIVSVFALRFAPSPTGLLHLGNARTALLNAVLAHQHGGKLYLRIDDTDKERSCETFTQALHDDLAWLKLSFDLTVKQSERLDLYKQAIADLKAAGRLYACYETPEELKAKREALQKAGKPPRYDRSARTVSKADLLRFEKEGRRPHWRFLLEGQKVGWNDLVRGPTHYDVTSLSDPVLVRADGSPSFLLTGCVDDLEMGITSVLRGQDHVANTAVQLQIMSVLDNKKGLKGLFFGHLPLLEDLSGKLSKRTGALTLSQLRQEGVLPEVLQAFLLSLGLSRVLSAGEMLSDLAQTIRIADYKGSHPKVDIHRLYLQNQQALQALSFEKVRSFFEQANKTKATEPFWMCVRDNITTLREALFWYDVCFASKEVWQKARPSSEVEKTLPGSAQNVLDTSRASGDGYAAEDAEERLFLEEALKLLPAAPLNQDSWALWTQALKEKTHRKGKALYLPLRKVLTGCTKGPSMHHLLPLIEHALIIERLKNACETK
ncbi:MAG: glutamate--tRNA ligase [Holosporaceae bacterium]